MAKTNATTARKPRANRQPNTGKAKASTREQTRTIDRPRTRISAADLLRQEESRQIEQARSVVDELNDAMADLGEVQKALAILEKRNAAPSPELVATRTAAEAAVKTLEQKLEGQGNAAGIARFQQAAAVIREMAPQRLHKHGPECANPCTTADPNAEYDPPSEGEYIQAVHGLLEVTDHQSVDPNSYAKLEIRDQRHLVFCPCREHRQNEYALNFGQGRTATVRATFFSFDRYGESKAIRSTADNAVRTYSKVREGIRDRI